MNNTIIFLSLFIIFVSLMLSIKLVIYVDILKDKLIIKVYLFKIKILTINISIFGLTYSINNNKKIKSINLNFLEDETYFIKQIKDSILKKLYYDNIYLLTNFGIGNASNSTLTTSSLNALCYIIKSKLNEINRDTDFYYENKCNFVQNSIQLYLELNVYFTIFDMIFAIIMSFYRRRKYAKQK